MQKGDIQQKEGKGVGLVFATRTQIWWTKKEAGATRFFLFLLQGLAYRRYETHPQRTFTIRFTWSQQKRRLKLENKDKRREEEYLFDQLKLQAIVRSGGRLSQS
ncbi:hypothetical protein HAX54_004138 [Datura stramonium]|uniref:Uncharacterized protein n=1 Tax=Datura stramonium TaxID=4076 RepID=A0ABS8WSN7_DATST|nr:hypothetical protein [Datura stramonium]